MTPMSARVTASGEAACPSHGGAEDVPQAQATFVERDDHGDGGVREGARGEGGGAGGEPGDRLGTTQQAGQGPEHDDGDRRLGDVGARLKAIFTGGERRWTRPSRRGSDDLPTSATGAARKSPTTRGISLRETVRP